MRRISLFVLVATITQGRAVAPGGYVSDKDKEIAALADSRMDMYCQGGNEFRGSVDEESGKSTILKLLGDSDVAKTVFSKAKTPEEVSDVFMEEYGVNWFVGRAMAIIMALVTLVFCGLFCLFSLCRCCAYERPTKPALKKYAAIVIGVVLFGLLICTIQTLSGYFSVNNGMYNVQCTSVRLFDTILRGEPVGSGSFRGLLPVLEEFQKAENTLEHGSQFMLGMENVLHMTDSINRSATLVHGSLLLLQDMMKQNKDVSSAAGKDLFHECQFCTKLGESLEKALGAFGQSAAGKLAVARDEIKAKASEEEKAKIKASLQKSAEELVELKTSVIDMTKEMLSDDGGLKKLKEKEGLIGYLTLLGVLIVTVCAIVLGACAGVSVYRFTFHEMDAEKEEQGVNPYNPQIHKYAHTTWCCGFCYIVTALTVAGLIFCVATPAGSMCLLMDDLDGETLKQIAPGLGMDLTDPSKANAPEMVDKCFHPTKSDAVDTYLLDIIFTTHEGRKASAREHIQRAMKDGILSRFASLTEGSDQPAPPIADSAEQKALKPFFAFSDLEKMVVGADAKLRNEDDYADMGIPKAGLADFMSSSISCADYSIPGDLNGGQSGKSNYGIDSLSKKLQTMGTAGAGGPCSGKVTCTPGGYTEHACKAANRYIDLKATVQSSASFRCDFFAMPKDPSKECDPQHMTSEEGLDGTIWSNDCLTDEGALNRKQKTCTMAEFTTYVKGFDQRLQKLLKRLDDQMQMDQPAIGSAVSMLMQRHVLDRTDFVSNGVTCKFFSKYYQELINGGCYQGVVGMRSIAKSYVWCAVLAFLLVLSMYAVWCRSKGNIENWKSDRTEYKALLQKQKEEEEAAQRAREGKKDEEQTTWILADPNDPRNRLANAP